MFKKFNVLKLPDLLKLQELKTYFKFVHSELPTYLLELPLDLKVTIHNYNTRGHNKIHANVVIHEFAKKCLRYNIIKTVNNSPPYVISASGPWPKGHGPEAEISLFGATSGGKG